MRAARLVMIVLAVASCIDEVDDDALDELDAEVVNNDRDFIQVHVNNVENLETASEPCRGDWKDLIYYMKQHGPSPDLFLVQQVSGRGQLDHLIEVMNRTLSGTFEGVIADADPSPFASPCRAPKSHQTNAIIYRVGRFDRVGAKHTWKTWRMIDGECRRDPLSRTLNVVQKFRDRLTGELVTAASVHWSTTNGCAVKNIVELDDRLHAPGFGGALVIAGGDLNEPDRRNGEFLPWYARVNGELGGPLRYRDPIFARCRARDGSTRACLNDNWTIGQAHRIDFLFAQKGNGTMPRTSGARTISFDDADRAARAVVGSDAPANYSDHRAIRARIHY